MPGPDDFRRYVQDSGGEVSPAQGVYVETRCGWFSDRSVRYLASGRPVLVQDTGFLADQAPAAGIFTYRDLDGAVDGATRILRDWEHQAGAARELAETLFAHDVVLPPLLDACGL